MKQLTIFRILTYILLPLATFFGLMDLLMIPSAFGNPTVLLPVFLLAAFTIYTYAYFIFLVKNIDRNQIAKPSLKDWIKVNAYASLFLGFMLLFESLAIFFVNQADLTGVIDKFLDSQPNLPSNINSAFFLKIMHIAAYFLFFFSFLLLVHITMGLKYLKQYEYLFTEIQSPTED
jgi:hypothetical protein